MRSLAGAERADWGWVDYDAAIREHAKDHETAHRLLDECLERFGRVPDIDDIDAEIQRLLGESAAIQRLLDECAADLTHAAALRAWWQNRNVPSAVLDAVERDCREALKTPDANGLPFAGPTTETESDEPVWQKRELWEYADYALNIRAYEADCDRNGRIAQGLRQECRGKFGHEPGLGRDAEAILEPPTPDPRPLQDSPAQMRGENVQSEVTR